MGTNEIDIRSAVIFKSEGGMNQSLRQDREIRQQEREFKAVSDVD